MPVKRVERRAQPSSPVFVKPTSSGFYLETPHDILLLLEACERYPEEFPVLQHRINDEVYRPLIQHGNVFVFEQRDCLRRWTDCRKWMDNQQERNLWLVYREAVPVEKINSYGKGVNKHPINENRYLRPGVQPLPGGLHKRTVTVTTKHSDSADHIRTLSVICFVDPRRKEELRNLAQHPSLSTIYIPEDLSVAKYQFKDDVALAKTGRVKRSRRQRLSASTTPGTPTPSLCPSMTPASAYSSLSPVTPFPCLPTPDPFSKVHHSHYGEPVTWAHHSSQYPQLPPLHWPVMRAKQVSLPPLCAVVGDLLGLGHHRTYMQPMWNMHYPQMTPETSL